MPENARGFDPEQALAMRDAMIHRGPDDAGHWVSEDGRAMLGSRRLAIIDVSSAGHMPMWNQDHSAGIVFNGECYNYTELRQSLLAKGYRFQSQTDTESLLHLYNASQTVEEMLRQIRGMFTLAIWDSKRRRMLIARDRMGIKPVYYSRQNGGIVFASEVRAVLASGRVSRELSPTGTCGYFAMGSAQAPETPLAEVHALPPGHYLLIENGKETLRPYWSLHFEEDTRPSEEEWIAQCREALIDSVRRHMVADRPVGIFLSGGIDSSAMVALARHVEHAKLRTYSVVFGEEAYNEAPYSRQIAQQFETEHHEYSVSGADALRQLDTMVASLDLPSIDGMNTYLVSQVTRGDGTVVALSGLGSDEIFFGYPSFNQIPRMAALAGAGRIAGALLRAGTGLSRDAAVPGSQAARLRDMANSSTPLASAYFAFRGLLDRDSLAGLFRPEFVNGHAFDEPCYLSGLIPPGTAPAANAVSALELRAYMHNQLLRDSDVMSMAHSLELRVPFLDHPLVELLARVPVRSKRSPADSPKRLLVRSLPAPLPAEIWRRPKRGFTLPFALWLKNELRATAEEVMVSERSPLRAICRPEPVRALWDGFLAGRVHWSRVWCAVVFARWYQQFSAR
jgi:asparagine synthase (glutamine-hydrolysing)